MIIHLIEPDHIEATSNVDYPSLIQSRWQFAVKLHGVFQISDYFDYI